MSWRLPLSLMCWCSVGHVFGLEPTIPPIIIIDAGSSGTRIHMFKVHRNKHHHSFREIVPNEKIHAEPGLTSFIHGKTVDINGVSKYLADLTDAARKHFPNTTHDTPRLFFKATAGFRILYEEAPNTLLKHIVSALAQTNFEFDPANVEVCPGNKEGVFAYMGMNYMTGQLKPEATNSYGVLELGGVSTQIAFKPQGEIKNSVFDFYVDGDLIKIYSYGYDRLGKDEAFRRSFRKLAENNMEDIISHPCVLKGSRDVSKHGRTFRGSGDPELCLELVHSLLKCTGDDETYEVPPLPIKFRETKHAFIWKARHRRIMFHMPSPCRIMGVYTPPVSGDFYALKGFFYTVYNMGLLGMNDSKQFTPRDILQEAFKFCEKDYSEAVATGNSSGRLEKHIGTTCFDAMLVYCLLSAYGFKDHGPTFAFRVGGSVADWGLGAALYESRFLNLEMEEHWLRKVMRAIKKEYEPQIRKAIRYCTMCVSILVIVFARKLNQISGSMTRIEERFARVVVVPLQNDGIVDAAERLRDVPGRE